MSDRFEIVSDYQPSGDQPEAIRKIVDGFSNGRNRQTLLGVTGSGKTFTMANVIAELNRPALVLSHNKTLAAQLYREFKALFPNNAVEYFVSYYDYYQPEAYIARSDVYIEKDCSINEELDKVRLSTTRSLLERRDVIVVSSVSCIYGIGDPEHMHKMALYLEVGDHISRDDLLRRLIDIKYDRNDIDFHRGTFRVRGDVIDVFLSYEDKRALRIELFGDEIEALTHIEPIRGTRERALQKAAIYPATHYLASAGRKKRALDAIRAELADRLALLEGENRLVEAQRLEQRIRYDIEMMEEMGFCSGIENYSRFFDGRDTGEPPYTLLDYFPKDFLLFADESHVTIPQVRAMYNGDRARKTNLVEHGFRLPSALDNRPLRFEEFDKQVNQILYVSATPSAYELEQSQGIVIEQVIRPTGLVEPIVEIRPASNQVDDLLEEIRTRVERKERVLVTSLTKRMAEDLSEYYSEVGVKVRYLHSDIDTIERTEIIHDLRAGVFDVLVGVNLLREGLDLPEVSLVAVLDADKEGFLRDRTSLVQICGRAARHVDGHVILYADTHTGSIRAAVEEMLRRREKQLAYNAEHGITPRGIKKAVTEMLDRSYAPEDAPSRAVSLVAEPESHAHYKSSEDLKKNIEQLRKTMLDAAKTLEFERAAEIRDKIAELETTLLTS
jgi:excinuclease ABC subunit B